MKAKADAKTLAGKGALPGKWSRIPAWKSPGSKDAETSPSVIETDVAPPGAPKPK
jgi:hypothetical protein